MTYRMRTLSTIVAALLVAGTAFITLSAQPAQRPDRPDAGHRRGVGPGPAGGPMFRHLDLTDAQREQIRAIMQENREGTERPGQKRAELEQQLRAAVFADSPDLAKIDQLKAAVDAADSAALAHRTEMNLKIAQVLTPEQRVKAREARGPGAGRGPGRGGPGRGGPSRLF